MHAYLPPFTTSILVALVILGLGTATQVKANMSPMLPAGRTVMPREDASVRMELEHVRIKVLPVAEEEWMPGGFYWSCSENAVPRRR